MHRGISIAKKVGRLLATLGHRDADRGGDHCGLAHDRDGLGKCFADASSEDDGIASMQHVRRHNGELIAAQAGNDVSRPYDIGHSSSDLFQQLVASEMTE